MNKNEERDQVKLVADISENRNLTALFFKQTIIAWPRLQL